MIATPHLARPRLTGPLADAAVVVIEAGGGAGKTSLALELADTLDLVPVLVRLDAATRDAREVMARLAEVLRRSGLARAAAVAADAEDLTALPDVLDAIGDEPLLIVDDVHHADEALAGELSRALGGLGGLCRVVVSGRRVPVEHPSDTPSLTDGQLALTADEVVGLARLLRGDPDGDTAATAAALRAVTAGWVAPTLAALAAGRDDARGALLTVRDIVDEVLGRLDAHRECLAQLAHLPKFDPVTVEACDATAALAAAQDAGVPLRRLGGGWAVIANPFADELTAQVAFDPATRRRAAEALAEAGDVLLAAELLRRHDGDAAAARLLGSIDHDALLRVHGQELLDLISSLDDAALAAHPSVLLVGSSMAFLLARPDDRRKLVDRLLAVTEDTPAEHLAQAEDLLERTWRHPQIAELRAGAERLRGAADDDPEVAARLAEVDARIAVMGRGDDGHLAVEAWDRCVTRWERAGHRLHAAQATVWQALQGAWAVGHFERALELVNRATALAGSAPALRLMALTYRGMFLVDMGRYAEAENTFEQASALAHALRADVRRAHIAWFRARMASQQGDAAATVAAIQQAEAADITDAGGGVFFAADAATLLARVGEDAEAARHLEHALEHDPGNSEKVPLAAMDVAARRGDLDEALRWWEMLADRHATEPRDRWRHRLLLAWAAHTSGDPRAVEWAVAAFDGAAALGRPDLAFVREPAIARDLVDLAAEAGSRGAADLLSHGFATVRVLGTFAVDLPGAPSVSVGGKEGALVKYLAVVGGRAQQEAVMEALWPEVDPQRGRSRLRVVLSRLRGEVGDVVTRDGEAVTFTDGVVVDAVRFDDLAQRALLEGDPAVTEAAVNAYGGTLLPDDPYESWAERDRERLQWRYLALLDRLAATARESGDLERSLALLYVGIDAEPLVEDRYVQAAHLLLEQGRHSRARALLERAMRVLDARELRPSAELLSLLEQLAT